jgi:hypothetical protein
VDNREEIDLIGAFQALHRDIRFRDCSLPWPSTKPLCDRLDVMGSNTDPGAADVCEILRSLWITTQMKQHNEMLTFSITT